MKSKRILITINETPLNQANIIENLRTSLGITAGYKEHQIDLLFTGDSTYFLLFLKEYDELAKYLKSLEFAEARLYFDEKSLIERNIDRNLAKEPYIILTRDEISDLFNNSSFNLSF
jgi:sulfur relay (sulfurtransferase) DsrF/TusC family protein